MSKPKKKTATIMLASIKEPDVWGELIDKLQLSDKKIDSHFEWAEYASVELTIDSNLRVVSGRILPLGRR